MDIIKHHLLQYIGSVDYDAYTVDFSLEDINSTAILFPLNNLIHNIIVIYTENTKAKNFTYNSIIKNVDDDVNYIPETNEVELDITRLLSESFKRISIQMTSSNNYIKYKSIDGNDIDIPITGFISSNNIKNNAITSNHIANKTIGKEKVTFSTIDLLDVMTNYNIFNLDLCEYKYSPRYNTSTLLPTYNNNNNFVTLVVPIPEHGTLKVSKLFATDASPVAQIYVLDESKARMDNIPSSSIMSKTNFPYVTPFYTIYDDYMEFYSINNSKAKYTSLTFPVENINDIYIYYNEAYVPEWLYTDGFNNEYVSPIQVVLNNKFKVVQNKILTFFPQNFTRYINTNKSDAIFLSNAKYNLNGCAIPSSDTIGSVSTKMRYRLRDTLNTDIEKNINIQTIDPNIGNGLTKRVLFIGDSLTDADIYPKRVYELFQNDVMNITLLGTLRHFPI